MKWPYPQTGNISHFIFQREDTINPDVYKKKSFRNVLETELVGQRLAIEQVTSSRYILNCVSNQFTTIYYKRSSTTGLITLEFEDRTDFIFGR